MLRICILTVKCDELKSPQLLILSIINYCQVVQTVSRLARSLEGSPDGLSVRVPRQIGGVAPAGPPGPYRSVKLYSQAMIQNLNSYPNFSHANYHAIFRALVI